MTETGGFAAYDLAAGMFCEECGRPKIIRLYAISLTGCPACDEVITRHRCTTRPDLDDAELGVPWECPDCGTIWTATMKQATCHDCGQDKAERDWDIIPGDRVTTAPRRAPALMWQPMRNRLPRP